MTSLGGAEPFTPRGFHATVETASGVTDDVRVALVPAQLARLLADDAGIDALRACTGILVGGGSTRDSLLSTATELAIGVTTTYGATETAGGCVFDGVPLPGVTVGSDAAVAGRPGILTVDGPCVALGYRGEPGLTAQRFGPGRFLTTDLGMVGPTGVVTIIGRADDIVVIKGVNVSPSAVERVIADLPDIVATAVVTVDDAAGDPRICAFIEVRDDAPAAS